MKVASYLTKIKTQKAIFLSVAVLLLTVASAFVAYKEARLNTLNSDVFAYNSLLSDGLGGGMYVNGEHSFLFKFPLFMLENLLGMSQQVHVVFSVLLLLGMNFGILYIVYRVSKKNSLVTALSALVLTSVTLFYVIQDYFWGFSPITIRNIEIPLTLGVVMILAAGQRISVWIKLFALGALTLLFSSDRLLIGVVGVSVALLLIADLLSRHRLSNLKENAFFYAGVLLAVALSRVIEYTLTKFDLVVFSTTKSLEFAESAAVLFGNIPKFFTDLFNITGSDIFNKDFLEALPYGVNLLILIALFVTYVIFSCKKWTGLPVYIKIVALFIPASAILYFFVKNGATDRYLIFILPTLLIVAAFRFRDIKIVQRQWKYATVMFSALIFITVGLFIPARADRTAMSPVNYNTIAPSVAKTVEVSDVLMRNNVSLLMGDFWIVHTTKFYYDDRSSDESLQIVPTELLSEDKVGFKRFISKEAWLTNPLKRPGSTAYAIRQTDPQVAHINTDDVARLALGEYDHREVIERNGQKVAVYIFKEDKRVKLLR